MNVHQPRGGGRRRAAPRPAERGFTLLETVIGLSILLIGTLGLVAAIVTSLQAGRVTREHTVALAAAQQRMDEAIAATETELLAMDGQTFQVDGLEARTDGTPLGLISIDTTGAPLYGVEVQVRWMGPYGDEVLALQSTVLPQ